MASKRKPSELNGHHRAEPGGAAGGRVHDAFGQGYRVPTIHLEQYEIDPDVVALVSRELCEAHRVVPVSRAGNALVVAFADVDDLAAVEALEAYTRMSIQPVVASEESIRTAIEKYYGVKR
jgi:type IV pilus assembly protein PilB